MLPKSCSCARVSRDTSKPIGQTYLEIFASLFFVVPTRDGRSCEVCTRCPLRGPLPGIQYWILGASQGQRSILGKQRSKLAPEPLIEVLEESAPPGKEDILEQAGPILLRGETLGKDVRSNLNDTSLVNPGD